MANLKKGDWVLYPHNVYGEYIQVIKVEDYGEGVFYSSFNPYTKHYMDIVTKRISEKIPTPKYKIGQSVMYDGKKYTINAYSYIPNNKKKLNNTNLTKGIKYNLRDANGTLLFVSEGEIKQNNLKGIFDSKEDVARTKYFAKYYLQDNSVISDIDNIIDIAIGKGSWDELCEKNNLDPMDLPDADTIFKILDKQYPKTLKKFGERGEKQFREDFGADGWSEQLKKIREGKLSGVKTRKTMRKSKSKRQNLRAYWVTGGWNFDWDAMDKSDDLFFINPKDKNKTPFLLQLWCGSGYLVDSFVVFANKNADIYDIVNLSFEKLKKRKPQIIFPYSKVRKWTMDNWDTKDDDEIDDHIAEEYISNEDGTLFAFDENFRIREITDKKIIAKIQKALENKKSKNKNTMNGIVPEGYKNVSKADIADEMSKQFPKVAKSTLKKMIDEYWVAITKILKSGKDSFIRINNVGSFKIVTKQYNKIVGKGKKATTKKATTKKVKFEPSKNFESLVIKGKDLRKKRTGSTKTKTKAAAKNSGKSGSKNAAKTRTKKN